MTRRELAVELGCHPQSVAKWIESGLPVARRGKGGRPSLYDVAKALAWKEAHEEAAAKSPDLMASRARKELAQAIEAEQRVAIKAKELVRVSEVERVWSARIAAYRTRVLAMPAALADKLLRAGSTEGAAGIERELQAALYQALREFADGTGTTPEPKARRVKAPKARAASRSRRR